MPARALPEDGAGAVDVLRLHAQAYARARGFEITSPVMCRLVRNNVDHDETIAVEFDVVVGKGDIHLDQRVPGVLDAWTWSQGEVDWWAKLLGRVATPIGQRLRVREDGEGGKVIEGHFGLGDPRRMPGEWRGPEALRGEGIHPAWSDPDHPVSRQLRETYAPPIPPADQRPPWLRRADGWDEDDEQPLGEHPPL